MASNFKLGSIAELVNSTGKKVNKKVKKVQSEDEECLPASSITTTPKQNSAKSNSPKSAQKANSGKKRKIVDAKSKIKASPVNELVVEKSQTIPKKKKLSKPPRNKFSNKLTVTTVTDNDNNYKSPKVAAVVDSDASTLSLDSQSSPQISMIESKQVQENKENGNEEDRQEKLSRTLFIGNLPANFSPKNLKKILSQFGKVASFRIRSVVPAKQTLSKKAALLSKQINPNKKTVNAYVVYKGPGSVQKAISLNGTEFEGNIIQVDTVSDNPTFEHKFSVFLGNLSFKTIDNEVREFFKDCGEIASVRVIRDSTTGIGKGFGYVTFRSQDGVVLSLEKNGQTFNGREVRVQSYQYNSQASGKKKDGKKQRHRNKFQKQTKPPASPTKLSPGKQSKPLNDDATSTSNASTEEKMAKKNMNKKQKSALSSTIGAAKKKEFKGEMSAKTHKLAKKSMKNRIKSKKVSKQKKKISEILSK